MISQICKKEKDQEIFKCTERIVKWYTQPAWHSYDIRIGNYNNKCMFIVLHELQWYFQTALKLLQIAADINIWLQITIKLYVKKGVTKIV